MSEQVKVLPPSEMGLNLRKALSALPLNDVQSIVGQELMQDPEPYIFPRSFFDVYRFMDFDKARGFSRTPINVTALFREIQKLSSFRLWISLLHRSAERQPQLMENLLAPADVKVTDFVDHICQQNGPFYTTANMFMTMAALKGRNFSNYIKTEGHKRPSFGAAQHIGQQFGETGHDLKPDELLSRLQQIYPEQHNFNDERTALGSLVSHGAFYRTAGEVKDHDNVYREVNKCVAVDFSANIYSALGTALRSPEYQERFLTAVSTPY